MSRALHRRLERVEAAMGPKVLGYFHVVYATDMQDYERQRKDLIASGRAKPRDLIFDANWQTPVYRGNGLCDPPVYREIVKEPETLPWSETFTDWLLRTSKESAS
jgi:hypothetical protein